MRLVNMDVDRLDSKDHYHLGPLSPGLNSICGPRGAGKTTLLGWLRRMAADAVPSHEIDGSFSSTNIQPTKALGLAGALELENRGRPYQVLSDREGRISFDSLQSTHGLYSAEAIRSGQRIPDATGPASVSRGGYLSSLQRSAFEGLAALGGSADTESALQQLASRLGITDRATSTDDRRDALLAHERDLLAKMQNTTDLKATRESALARVNKLEQELEHARRTYPAQQANLALEQQRIEGHCAAIEVDLQAALRQVEELDRAMADRNSELKRLETSKPSVDVGETRRSQLLQLDDRLDRWRQTLRDLKLHREMTEHHATDARLDKQIGDQFSATQASNPREAMRSLEAQILNTRRQLDELLSRTTIALPNEQRSETGQSRVYRDASGRTYVGRATSDPLPAEVHLSDALRAMQAELYEVCQQLARREAAAASETLKQQSLQLQRCELELLRSVERLIEERGTLLRKIAEESQVSVEQLTLAFGQWCQCHDHPHLHDWLLSHDRSMPNQPAALRSGEAPVLRQQLQNGIEALQRSRQNATVRAEECRRQHREADVQLRNVVSQRALVSVRLEADIQRDLDQAKSELAAVTTREHLLGSLAEVREQLRDWQPAVRSTIDFRALADRHIASLMGPGQRAARPISTVPQRRYDPVDGIVTENVESMVEHERARQVPSAILRVAMRLAIAEYLASIGEPVCLVLDEALDHVPREIQQTAVQHLASVAAANQQLIVLTGEESVADLVRSHHGWVGYLRAPGSVAKPLDIDVNRHLTALANDHEYDKWYQPSVEPKLRRVAATNEYYLTDRSHIEDLPSIDPSIAARFRTKGIDRIGDFLDVDPHWLVDQVRAEGVSYNDLVGWQAEARLLSGVRKLRPFDARVLVGAGVRAPAQVAAMRPRQLLERVERFLATESGRKILRSGSSYELTRITAWIASAEGGKSRLERTSIIDEVASDDYDELNGSGYETSRDSHLARTPSHAPGTARSHDRDFETYRSSPRRERSHRDINRELDSLVEDHDLDSQDDMGNADSRSNGVAGQRARNTGVTQRAERNTLRSPVQDVSRPVPSDREDAKRNRSADRDNSRSYPIVNRDGVTERSRAERTPRRDGDRERLPRERERRLETVRMRADADSRLKFYLEPSSTVVDAPSIGPRMAAKLEQLGIVTVNQFLAANAEVLASKLNQRRVDADTIRAWQEQARLVCRIPNLRGHDAQLLVACDLTSPEELATLNPASVLAEVLAIAQSADGQRILRGSKEPDLEEVTDWIAWAASSRSLNAA